MIVGSGIVATLNLVLSLVIGIRLARRPSGGIPAPERILALFFLFYAFIGNIGAMTAYGAWADPSMGLPAALIAPFAAVGVLGNAVGTAAVYLFTWRTFRPDDAWARALALAGVAAIAMSFAYEWLAEGFAIRVVTGPGHFVGLAFRVGAFVWMAGESFRYFELSRRRLRLGLADAMVTNRFLLFGTWSITTFCTAMSEVPARVLYMRIGGSGEIPVMEVAQSIIFSTILVTMLLGALSAGTLFLTFFPTSAYERWVTGRTAEA